MITQLLDCFGPFESTPRSEPRWGVRALSPSAPERFDVIVIGGGQAGLSVLSIRTPMGRRARPRMMRRATPLIRTKRADLVRAGAQLAGRVLGVSDGQPLAQDGKTLDVQNVIWCTGFDPSRSFIKLPIFDDNGEPMHEAGVVTSAPGMYFVGLPFMYSASSAMIHGVGRDANRIAGLVKRACQAIRPRTAS